MTIVETQQRWLRIVIMVFAFFAASSAGWISVLVAQTKEQAETVLKTMTPEEIDAKLKEMGISREEAISRAAALNINLEEYLGKLQSTQNVKQAQTESSVTQAPANLLQGRIGKAEPPAVQKDMHVHGFSRRVPAGMQAFGYSIFENPVSTFEPILNIATPPTYVLGPGDEVVLSVWGDTKLFFQLPVNREGNILIPDVGPVAATGFTVQQIKEKLVRRMTAVYSSLRNGERGATSFLDLSLGKLRTIQIFILGEVPKPGVYALSSLSTALHALYLSGGPTINGSLRNIQIQRGGKVVSVLDFYDYALRADQSKDIRLQDGDILFVKPAGRRAAVVGLVMRPAIYELAGNENLGELMTLAGGLRFDAYFNRVHVERLIPFDERKEYRQNFLDFDLRFSSYEELGQSKFEMADGDVVTILPVDSLPHDRVTITGNVKKPGVFQLRPGMAVSDLILAADSLDRNTFAERGTLFRLLPTLRREVIPFNPRLALAGDSVNNVLLANEDSLVVYKESQFFPEHTVSVGGAVRNPGNYPRYEGMTVSDLVVMAGGLREDASKSSWELARMDTTRIGALSKIRSFGVNDAYWEDRSNRPIVLKDFDHLMVPSNPRYNMQRVVDISGYVMYPGTYSLREEGERVSSIFKRAGGLRPGAYLEGSTIVRKWNNAGIVPIDFKKALADTESLENITLLAGDSITVAFKQEVVMVRGEVFFPSAVVYQKGESLSHYLKQAGGLKDDADDGRIVVTLPNGRKWDSGWFIFPDPDILGGSTIYVPKKIEKEDKTLPELRDWATIIVSMAAIIIGVVQITK